jgi:hypothetical protein
LAAASTQLTFFSLLAVCRPRLFDVLGAGVSAAWGVAAATASSSGRSFALAFPFALPWRPLWPFATSKTLPTKVTPLLGSQRDPLYVTIPRYQRDVEQTRQRHQPVPFLAANQPLLGIGSMILSPSLATTE